MESKNFGFPLPEEDLLMQLTFMNLSMVFPEKLERQMQLAWKKGTGLRHLKVLRNKTGITPQKAM